MLEMSGLTLRQGIEFVRSKIEVREAVKHIKHPFLKNEDAAVQ